jgi:hypothetical protein
MNSNNKKKVVDLDLLLEQIGPRPLTNADSNAFSEAIRKHKERERRKKESGEKLHPTARKFIKAASQTILVSEPRIRYKKSKWPARKPKP